MISCGPQDYGYSGGGSIRPANGTITDRIIPGSDIDELPSGITSITRSY